MTEEETIKASDILCLALILVVIPAIILGYILYKPVSLMDYDEAHRKLDDVSMDIKNCVESCAVQSIETSKEYAFCAHRCESDPYAARVRKRYDLLLAEKRAAAEAVCRTRLMEEANEETIAKCVKRL